MTLPKGPGIVEVGSGTVKVGSGTVEVGSGTVEALSGTVSVGSGTVEVEPDLWPPNDFKSKPGALHLAIQSGTVSFTFSTFIDKTHDFIEIFMMFIKRNDFQ